MLITQNVDDLHEQAGSQNVVHLHGTIAGNQCFNHCQGNPTPIDITQLEYDEGPPLCPHCGAYVRPAVVWFNEMLPPKALSAARAASQQCDVMLVVGTSGLVMPAAALPDVARRSGAHIIEVNPDDTPITPLAAVKLTGPSGEMLPQLVEALTRDA
jgi:NAD-dependent deacetylase